MMNLFDTRRTLEIAALSALDSLQNSFEPRLRLGVTGLSRAGKTIFITALVKALLEGGKLPQFRALSEGRLIKVTLAPQPDDKIPRFAYETHVDSLFAEENRAWPLSTAQVSEIRLQLTFKSNNRTKTLLLDIVDYPGEWLLDLPLLDLSFEEWSRETLLLAQKRVPLAGEWLTALEHTPVTWDERKAKSLADTFTAYLRGCRADKHALSMLPPGRFLMPGDLEGSPALTFSPLLESATPFYKEMQRRYEAYKQGIVYPFFRDHFARLDRQIVLIDALAALNAGQEAVQDLEKALSTVFSALHLSKSNFFTAIFKKSIDKTLVAATKADHLHHSQHARLEALVAGLAARALKSPLHTTTLALASVRATREAEVTREGKTLPCVLGVPLKGEEGFDGVKEIAVYTGDFETKEVKFLRFRPPLLTSLQEAMPHIRLDRVCEELLGDYLK
jgi:uncharacterized protein